MVSDFHPAHSVVAVNFPCNSFPEIILTKSPLNTFLIKGLFLDFINGKVWWKSRASHLYLLWTVEFRTTCGKRRAWYFLIIDKKAILVPSVIHLLCCIPDLKVLPDVSFVIYKDVNTGPTSSWKICIHIFSTPISSCKGPQRKLRHWVSAQQFANRKETIPGLVEICWPVDYWQSVQPQCWTRKCVTTANAPVAARAHEQESSELNSSP